MRRAATLLAAALLACAARGKGRGASDVQAIEEAELRRRPDGAVRALLDSPDAALSTRAALAAGRLHDALAVPELARLLPAEETAAWALGRIEGGEAALVSCVTQRCPTSAAAARALGGPGRGPAAIEALATALAGPAALAAEAATALALIARLSGGTAPQAVAAAAREPLLAALARPEAAVRAGAAMALGRAAETKGESLPAALEAALRDSDAGVRLHAPRAAARNGAAAGQLAPLLRDADWRVRVEAARALAGLAGAAAVIEAALPAAVADAAVAPKWAHALLALLEAAGRAHAHLPGAELRAPSKAATAAIRCAAAEAHDRAQGKLERLAACGAGFEPGWRTRLRAGAVAAELGWPEVAQALADADGRVRAQAAGAASPSLAPRLRALLADDADAYVVADAAGSLAKDAKVAKESLPAALAAIARYSTFRENTGGTPEADALAALVQLVAAGRKGEPPPAVDPLAALSPAGSFALHVALVEAGVADPPPALHAAPSGGQDHARGRLVLETTAGELAIDLRGGAGEAPLTAAAIAGLAGRGFYDGLSWHRVVGDFVIQGGDPRGDGDGSGGFSLPDEHTPLRFLRGTVGIATNGPGTETGSAQIFLCHSPQPHLDGRYTVVGQLAAGDEVVMDAIHVGDIILRARIE